MTTPTRDLAATFLTAAQALGDRMLVDLTQRDPELAEAVATAVEHGERLAISLTLGDAPVIELIARNDYDKVRRIASIPLCAPAQH